MGLFNNIQNIFRGDKESQNAIQINDVNNTPYSWTPYFFPGSKGDKPLGNLFLQSILNLIWRGISNISMEETGKSMITPDEICKFMDANSVLLVNMYIRKGYICIFYDKNGNYRIPNDNEIKLDGNGRVINKFAVVIYSPQYQTERKSLINISLPIVTEINKLAGTSSYLTEQMGVWGILQSQEIPGTPQLREKFAKSLNESYGLGPDKLHFILSNREFNFVEIKPPVKDLQLDEKIEKSYKYLCNLWGIPLQLIFNDASTFNNVKEARIYFYNNTIREYAEVLLKVARELLTASSDFIPQSAIIYRISNVPEIETTLSAAAEERTALLDYLLKLKEAGIDVNKEIKDLYIESKDLLKRV